MADIFNHKKRSLIMSKISGSETKPEIIVRKYLFSKGFRYRKNYKKLPGKPDVVLPKYRVIIFVNGCFWHGHRNCKAAKLPDTRKEFWEEKIKSNIDRDKKNVHELKLLGWKVIIVWQCEIKNEVKRKKRFDMLLKQIQN